MTATAKGPRPEDLPAVHPDDLPAMLRDAKRAGLHRAAPRKLPQWLMIVAILAGPPSLALDGWAARAAGVTALALGVAYFVQHFRHAGWVVTTGAAKELER